MAITGNITKQSIIDRFEDLVTDIANYGITWGTNNKPFPEMPDASYGGTTAGVSINITDADITDTIITASTIRTVLETEAALYTNIKLQNAKLFVEGTGGNTGSRPTAGLIISQTQFAHLDTADRSALGTVSSTGVTDGDLIDDATLETYLSAIATAYSTIKATTTIEQINVCHASCHNSCHSSRGRR